MQLARKAVGILSGALMNGRTLRAGFALSTDEITDSAENAVNRFVVKRLMEIQNKKDALRKGGE